VAGSAAGLAAGSVVGVIGVTAGSVGGSAGGSAAGPAAARATRQRRRSGDGDGGDGGGGGAERRWRTALSSDGTRQRGPQTCGVAALHRHVRDELLQVIVGDVSWSAGSEPPSAGGRTQRGPVLVEGGSVRGQLVLGEEGCGRVFIHSRRILSWHAMQVPLFLFVNRPGYEANVPGPRARSNALTHVRALPGDSAAAGLGASGAQYVESSGS
jgi:hypothetical protein